MKRKYFFIIIVLLTCCIITSCSEKSINPSPPDELNDITSPPCYRIDALAINSQGDFFAATLGGLFRSSNSGRSWDTIHFPIVRSVVITEIKITTDDFIFVISYYSGGTSAKILRSSDNGNSWTVLSLTGDWFRSIEVDQYNNIYVCGPKVYKSNDKGEIWEEIYDEPVDNICFPNDSLIIIGVPGYFIGEFLYTNDNGNSWLSTGYNANISEFYIYNSVVFAGCHLSSWGPPGYLEGSGIHKSADGGINWEFIGLNGICVNSIILNSPNQIICGSDRGIYLSADIGETWQNVLADSVVKTLMKDSRDFLYAGTNKGTFLRSTDNGITWHN